MKKSVVIAALVAGTFMIPFSVSAQYKTKDASEKDSQTQEILAQAAQDCETLKAEAAARMDKATQAILRRVVES